MPPGVRGRLAFCIIDYLKLWVKGPAFQIALLDKLLSDSKSNQLLARVELSKSENAQAIFDGINSTGVRLSDEDIIQIRARMKGLTR